MAKPSITTRATKGSALTWTEGDANLENLRDATVTIKAGAGGTDVVSDLNGTVTLVAGTNVSITGDNTNKTVTINSTSSGLTDVIQDTTPQLGGNLDVNGYAILSANNGHIDITPNGTGNIRLTPATGKITLGATDWPSGMGTNGQVLTTNGTGTLSWTTPATGSSDVVSDTTPQLGGDLDVNGKAIVSVSNGNIRLEPNGSGNIMITPTTGKIILGASDWPSGMGTNGQVLTTNGAGTLSWSTISGGATTLDELSDVVLGTPAAGEVLYHNGTNWVDTALSGLTAGVASTVTLTADNTTNSTEYPLFSNVATGNASPRTDTGFTYNPSTGILTASGFSGPHNGTVGAGVPSTGVFTTLTVNAANDLRLADSDSSNYVGFKAPATVSANKIWTLPSADGTNGQVLSTNGSGTLSWATAGGSSPSFATIKATYDYSAGLSVVTSASTFSATWSEVSDPSGIVTVSGDNFTLGAGTFIIEFKHNTNMRCTLTTNSGTVMPPIFDLILYNSTSATDLVKKRSWPTELNGQTSGQTKQFNYGSYDMFITVTLAGSTTFNLRKDGSAGSGYSSATLYPVFYAGEPMILITKIA